jgi:hypothetical protein
MAGDIEKQRDDLINTFEQVQTVLKDDRAYYEAEKRPDAIGLAVPPEMRGLLSHVGYPRLYVDSIAERQELEGFRIGGKSDADTELWDWWQANDLDIEATLGHTDSLIYGRSYITVAVPDPTLDPDADPEVPLIRVEPPTSLYADIDPRTKQVLQAIRVVYDNNDELMATTLYTPEQTVQWVKEEGQFKVLASVNHGLMVVPVIPLPNRTRLSDMYGTSEITPELRSVTDAAARILMDMQGTAEIMAIPQRLIFGVKPEDLGIDPVTGEKLFNAYLARIMAFEDADAKAQQFTAAELRNFVDALDALDRKAAAYTGLPPQYLSTSSENPASAEAIKSSESRLVKKTERKNKIFGGAWEQAMRVAYKAIKGGDLPPEYLRMESVWRDPSTPTYAAKADAAAKLYANGAGIIPKERARVDLGYSIEERIEMRAWDEEANPVNALGQMLAPTPTPKAQPQAASAATPA